MSARSTGWVAATVTRPVARSTVTDSTPATAEISSATARRQWSQVMRRTEKVVEPTNVRGVLDNIGNSLIEVVVRDGESVGGRRGGSRREDRQVQWPWGPWPEPTGVVGLPPGTASRVSRNSTPRTTA